MRKLIYCLLLVICVVGVAAPASAASDEVIRSFDTDIILTRDGTAHVRESIVYDFGSTSKHGIYRDIPIDYKDGSNSFYITAKYVGTTNEHNEKVTAETDEVNGNLRIRLGDPDKTINGIHTYVISYTLSPVVMQKDGKPFLNLDVLGAGWQVPIDNFSASIQLENGALLRDARWFNATGGALQATTQNIPAYQPVTVNAFLSDAYTTNYLQPGVKRPFDIGKFIAEFGILILIGIVVLAVAAIFWLRWWQAHRKRKSQTIIPEYDPPKSMTPAEIGLLDDDSSDMREVTATVIDWAVRGYITITQLEKKGLFGGRDYSIAQRKNGETLPQLERPLFDAFFEKGTEVQLKNLNKSTMARAVSTFQSTLKKQLKEKGYYAEKGGMISRGNLTDEGARQWAKVEGFQLYLTVVEKDRLKFSDAPEKTPKRFNALLPYAVALGVEKQWAKQFDGIDVSRETSWYAGNMAAFSAVNLASDIGTTFASTVSSNSSVSSSGGSAGGGVGGGGGGSW